MSKERWVVKAGSQMVCSGGPILLRAWMQQLLDLKRKYKIEVIWVTSGAISSAVERTNFKKTKKDWNLSEKQALSAIGQPLLMDMYNLALHATGLLGAQVLLDYHDLNNSERRRNFQHTIEQLLAWDVVPILNENDAVATDEIKFGDNDTLSAKVACVTKSDRLVVLTDVDGLYDRDPKKDRNAKLIDLLPKISSKLLTEVGQFSGSKLGTGGMLSKLRAARIALQNGVETVLVKGDTPNVLTKIAAEDFKGTLISKRK